MARKIIDIGVEGNDGTGDSIRESFRKSNENFQELYAVFGQGGQISFTDLDDTPDTLEGYANAVAIVDPFGSSIQLKPLVGLGGITIDTSGDNITINSTTSRLQNDPAPRLSYHLNARDQMIGNVKNPDSVTVAEFNATYGTALTLDDFLTTRGYNDARYVNITGDSMTGHLNTVAGATGTQVPQVQEIITRAGSTANRTMLDVLTLHDHPGDLSGFGTPNGADDLQAATKFYVDNSSYSSQINLFVTTQGDDSQTLTPAGQEGRSNAYAFATIGKACELAEELLADSNPEPGPYRQQILYNDAASVSVITNITTGAPGTETTRIFFSNNAGLPVDQGNPANTDLVPGKVVVGRTSGATGIIYFYYGPDTGSNSDYFDLSRVRGTFVLGEELEYGEPVKDLNISIYIESGIYYEDYPIRVPPNVALIGDEMRRTIIRPNDRVSQSRWVDTWFFRNKTFDGLTITTSGTNEDTTLDGWYGYHYLSDPSDRNSTPKNNKEIDVFLCNDSVIMRQICCQGHGGFMMVLDPVGQILSKSPYCQQASTFSQSINKQAFRGGQFVDGFCGNLPATVVDIIDGQNMVITDIPREPQVPTSYFIEGKRFKVNDYIPTGDGYENAADLLNGNRQFIQSQTIAYINTTYPSLVYKEAKCRRDVGLVIDAVIFDLIYGGNKKTIDAARKYYAGAVSQLPSGQSAATIDSFEYVKSIASDIVQNITVTSLQTEYVQIKDLANPGEVPGITKIEDLVDIVIGVVSTGLGSLPAVDYPLFQLVIDQSTPITGNPTAITLLTAGNTSMLSNDYTQINDLGYGLVGVNNALLEAVSVFTYYCWTGYYTKDGAQIRSLTGNNSYGVYGLVAEGADVLEIPDPVSLLNNQVHVAKVYKRDGYSNTGLVEEFQFYIEGFQYVPYGQGFVDINHGSVIGIRRYPMASVSDGSSEAGPGGTALTPRTVIRITMTTTNVAGLSSGLAATLTDGQYVTIYAGQQQIWYDVRDVTPTRPSTSLTYLGDANDDEAAPVYRVINYSIQDPLGTNLFTDAEISSVTQSNPAVVTTTAPHGFSNGDRIRISEVEGMTALNDNDYYITLGDAGGLNTTTKFRLYTNKARTIPVDSTAFNIYTPGSIGKARKNGDLAYLETDDAYNYVVLTVDTTHTTGGFGRAGGDTKIAVQESFSAVSNPITFNRLNTGQMLFAWDGKVHRITSYVQQTGWGYITFVDTDNSGSPLQDINTGIISGGLQSSVDPATNASLVPGSNPSIYIGLQKDEPAEIITRISTVRATAHDFLDIGTGGYNQSNYPSKIYGPPAVIKDQDNEVDERSNGRVFYVSTDQDGFFRVGRFFSVDQGTGTVGIDAGRIALEGITALKFKRGGARVSEFSTDSDFTLANDEKVPTQLAIQNYINKRLGKSELGTEVNTGLIGGGGFLDVNGVNAAVNNISIGGFKLLNVGAPTTNSDGVNKLYVDTKVSEFDQLSELLDVTFTGIANNNILAYDGTEWINVANNTAAITNTSTSSGGGSDITIARAGNTITFKLVGGQGAANPITNHHVNDNAAINQTKLALDNTYVTTAASISGATATRATTTATLTFAAQATAPFAAGQRIVVTGFTTTGYNGTFTVLTCTTTTLTYTVAGTLATPAVGTGTISPLKGISSFNSARFTANSGWVDLATSTSATTGVTLNRIQHIGNNTILGNRSGAAASPSEISPGQVVTDGDGIKNASFSSLGAMTVSTLTPRAYAVTAITTTGAVDSLVKTDANGDIDVKGLKIDSYKLLEVNAASTELLTPGGVVVLTTSGDTLAPNSSASTFRGSVTIQGNLSTSATTGTGAQPGNITAAAEVRGTDGRFTTSVITPLLTTGSAVTAGTVIGNWSLSAGSRFQATYADLAEYYEGDREYEPGTVLVFGGNKEVTITTLSNDRRVAGVVSNTAAYVMNVECQGIKVCVALQGRVPVKVVGIVKKGDMLVTSAKSGYAVVNNDPKAGTVIGKALANKDDLGEGIIEVAIGRL